MKKKVFKLFWAWQDEKENAWLERMGTEGWKLVGYHSGFYTFIQTEPKQYIYTSDYKSNGRKDIEEYIALFEDAGWEHAAEFLNWHYFRTEAEKARIPDIYSDAESKAEKFKGVLSVVLSILGAVMCIAATIVFNPETKSSSLYVDHKNHLWIGNHHPVLLCHPNLYKNEPGEEEGVKADG